MWLGSHLPISNDLEDLTKAAAPYPFQDLI